MKLMRSYMQRATTSKCRNGLHCTPTNKRLDSSFNAGSTPIIGRNGVVLQDIWDPHPEAYLGVCSPKMPNLFLYLGPNGGPAAGSFISMLEVVVFYFIKCIKKLQREHIASMEVS